MVKFVSRIRSKAHMVRDAAVVQVRSGAQALRVYSCAGSDRADFFLNGKLLCETTIGCPTCAATLARGYGINDINAEVLTAIRDGINAPYTNIEAATTHISPLLNLLQDGYYIVTDNIAFPTCGKPSEANYFWNMRGYSDEILHNFYGRRGENYYFPAYLVASQYAVCFNKDRLLHYSHRILDENGSFPRAVVLYLNGGAGLVLDGHHKVAAAAYCGVAAKCLSIFPLFPAEKGFSASIAGAARHNLQEWPCGYAQENPNNLPPAANQLAVCGSNGQKIAYTAGFWSTAVEVKADEFYEIGEYEQEEYDNYRKNVREYNIPGEYLQNLQYIPHPSDYALATAIPYDSIKLALRDFYRIDDKAVKSHIALRLTRYYQVFPQQKWVSEADYRKMREYMQRTGV